MKNITFKSTILIITLTILASVFSIPTFAKEFHESENNNSIPTANSIDVESMVYGSISSYNDDYYKFTVPSDGYISIQINKQYEEYLRGYFIYYDGNNEKTLYECRPGASSQKYLSENIAIESGTYYLEIEGNEQDYSFKISFTSSNNWESLFNKDVTCAKSISIGNTYYGVIYEYNDKDYFKFTLDKSSYIQITGNHEYGSNNHYFDLNTYDLTEEKTIDEFKVDDNSNSNKSKKVYLEKGTYYICVSGNSAGQYNFVVNIVSGGGSSGSENTTKKPAENATKKNQTTPKTTTPSNKDNEPNNNSNNDTRFEIGEENAESNVIYYNNSEFNYYIDNNYNGVIIVLYIGSDSDVVIPSDIDGQTVVGIFDEAFKGKGVDRVYIPDNVIYFGRDVFDDGVTIVCSNDSEAFNYANENGLYIEDDGSQGEIYDNPVNKNNILLIIIAAVILLIVIALVVYLVMMNNKKKVNTQNNRGYNGNGYNNGGHNNSYNNNGYSDSNYNKNYSNHNDNNDNNTYGDY